MRASARSPGDARRVLVVVVVVVVVVVAVVIVSSRTLWPLSGPVSG
jgi:cell division protein FtsL|tara:strand:+ start:1318 stop:1455 length:138 start_codon:yes stop_codon:yes gene_type:complete